MPLIGYHLIGFNDGPKSFDEIDYRLLQRRDHIAAVYQFFERCPHRLNFFFHNNDWDRFTGKVADREDRASAWLLHGRIGFRPKYNTNRTPRQDMNYFLAGEPRDLKAINFVFTSNVTGIPKIPMTPWMMAHRMGHVHMLNQENPVIYERLEQWGKIALELVYNHKPVEKTMGLHWYPCGANPGVDALALHGIWKAITTSRAGRMGRVNGFEYVPEWFAQYVRCGELRFSSFFPDRLNLPEILTHDHCVQSKIPAVELTARVKRSTGYVAEFVERQFEDILCRWRGEVIVT